MHPEFSVELSKEDIDRFELPAEIPRYIEQARMDLGLEPSEMRILDWGCGRGESVGKLNAMGYDAYGIDIDPGVIAKGDQALKACGFDTDRLSLIREDGGIDHADGFFHFVYSYQVLEHVADLDRVTNEIARVTSEHGRGLHIFPAQHRPIEGHLFMPIVHWLPKNGVRRSAISACTRLGMDPQWPNAVGKSPTERSRIYYDYSVDETYYRPVRDIRKTFSSSGLSSELVVLEHPGVRQHKLLGALSRTGLARAPLEWAIAEFQTVELATEKR